MAASSTSSKVSVPDSVLFRDLEGEAVLLELGTGHYFGLDEVGTRMWTVLSDLGEVEAAYQTLLTEFEVSEEQLRSDLLGFVDELVEHRLLELRE